MIRVDKVDARGGDLHQCFARGWLRRGLLAEAQHVGTSGLLDVDGFHAAPRNAFIYMPSEFLF